MPYNSGYRCPLFIRLVYLSRIDDIANMLDSNAIGSFSIAELNTQYNNFIDLDEIQSRTLILTLIELFEGSQIILIP